MSRGRGDAGGSSGVGTSAGSAEPCDGRLGGAAVAPDVRITLNFHPDRVSRGLPLLEALAQDGAYHSQFVTGTSNGG